MIDRHLVQQMDKALSLRANKNLPTNEQALLAYMKHSPKAGDEYVIGHREWFLPEPMWGGETYQGACCWLTPKGGMFSVDYGDHSEFACEALAIRCSELERGGWLHVSGGKAYVYFGRVTPAQQKVMDQHAMLWHDARGYVSGRMADDAKTEAMRGLEFRQRDGWDWRTDAVQDSGAMCAPLPETAMERAFRGVCQDRSYRDDIAF